MEKIVISVLGYDRPGIVAAVSRLLFEHECNIEDVSQTILQTEFAGVFVASLPEQLQEQDLLSSLQTELGKMGLSVHLKKLTPPGEWSTPESEPFVITTIGPDRLGLVAGMTDVMYGFGINITNLKAVFRGGEDPLNNVMIYEVNVPVATDQRAFRAALQERAKELDLDVSLQHRDIFEAIHRV
ncbi:MAG: ACT domain-containing protein [Desulforhabdus sp.]|jgi:glycine cleavage system transcriptional repressor|nr:ACT domain-containing protein [Desulforhabdus sp.]